MTDRTARGINRLPLVDDNSPTTLREWGLSWLRTAVPVAWGYVLTWLATRSPDIHDVLDRPEILAAVVGVVTVAWYGLMRWVEPNLPAWLTRFVLGANSRPVYTGPTVDGEYDNVHDDLTPVTPPLPREGDIV